MSPAQHILPSPSAAKRRWAVYALLVVAVLACYVFDSLLKTSQTAGFLSESATWQVEAADLPGAWARWQQLPPYKALRGKAPGVLQALPVAVRKGLGVRPTPSRLQVWFGSHVLAGGGDGGWCVSVRPGVALRLTDILGLTAGWPFTVDQEVIPVDFAHGWRDGFFLMASSQSYLDKILTSGQPIPRSTQGRDTLTLSWDGADAGSLHVRVAEGLPFSLAFQGAPTGTSAPLPVVNPWPEAIVSLVVSGRDMPGLLQRAGQAAARIPLASEPLALWRPVAGAWWRAYCPFEIPAPESGLFAAGVFATDFNADLPAVELLFAGRQGAPEPDTADLAGQAHRWLNTEGRLIAVPGDSRAWATARMQDTWYLASHEHLMPRALKSGLIDVEAPSLNARFQWAPFAQALLALARRGARESLLPGLNTDDVEQHLTPVLEALQGWGSFEISMQDANGAWSGAGYLARDSGSPE